MRDLNRVMLLGNIASEPDVYVTRSGVMVLSIRLATVEEYADRDDVKRERTAYHAVVMIGRRAEAVSKVLRKDERVFVEGALRTSSFESRDGKKWTKTEVVASDILFAGERTETAAA